ncbi:MAG TPA: 23S rRNA (adenine(2503)-C(2))-methyltransferase RlmN [Candidatus Eisenbacteria bacterium]|nr:23S rRNA (adenine(2503)-C(2))-methyltransferase RlmN [Candidatus Eisenbacteria bacterium]
MTVKPEPIILSQNGGGAAPDEREDLIGLSVPELERVLIGLGEKPFRGRQVAEWIYGRGARDFATMTNLPQSLRGKLDEGYRIGSLREARRRETPDRKTKKFALALPDGGIVESVYMSTPRRVTFCLSSQHGCGFACRFCATGRMGRGRNLTAGEILEQALRLRRELPPGVSDFNVVMMGMGEPLENYDAVITALGLLTLPAPTGIGITAKRITISTVGLVPQILRLANEGHRYRLAISLHAATDAARSKLMPINRTFPLAPLMKAVSHHVETTGRRVTFEYILIEEINDSVGDAAKLVRLVGQIPCKINLIPYNPIGPGKFKRPSEDRIQRFVDYLAPRVAAVTVRYSQGVDIGAACGQLAGMAEEPPR